ncbi:hypothetical protein FACS1894182_03300 [Bacteroidia bacterium]|nr:hypothetical protein FACS1894182_03300 [Bacteroidia bacterium]
MSIDFNPKDIIHQVTVKFVQAFLPGAKKKYNAKVVFQPRLDIHDIASKADVYNIGTSPKVIEDGLQAGFELMRYLIADGYLIDTPLFNIRMRVPGEYNGSETHLPAGIYPKVSVTFDAPFRQYIRDHVQILFDGVDETNGFIGQVTDSATGLVDQAVTIGDLVTIQGYGLKVEAGEEYAADAGVFFEDENSNSFVVKTIAHNEPRTLKVITNTHMIPGTAYTLIIRTQGSAKSSGHLLKELREIRSDIRLVAQSE